MKGKQVKPIFSVIIPIFNVEAYINECLDSVLSQTFTSFEVICVDDESPDNSVQLIRQYTDSRIKIVHQKNRGLAGARNTGINESKGVFVALIDGDDAWHPRKLENHFYHLQRNGKIGVSYSSSEFMDESSKRMGIGQYPKLDNISAVDIFCRNPVGNGSSAVIRKSLLLQVSRVVLVEGEERRQFFDESMRQSEDVEFWLRIALTCQYKFAGIEKTLTFYRVNSSGLSSNLENQYESWLTSVERNRHLDIHFFNEWFSLASAFQKRYLARRAINNRNPLSAIRLMHESFREDVRVIIHEPVRSFVTYGCAYLAFLPKPLFNSVMKLGMSSSLLISKA